MEYILENSELQSEFSRIPTVGAILVIAQQQGEHEVRPYIYKCILGCRLE